MADELYRPGFSFENPAVVKIAAPMRTRPWFYQQTTIGPLSKVSKDSPFWKNPILNRYQPVWNRTAKQRNMEKLGAYFQDIPTIQELGEAPGPTDKLPTTTRDWTGFLDNIITKAGGAVTTVTEKLTEAEVRKTQTAMAQLTPYMQTAKYSIIENWPLYFGIGVLGIGAFLYWRK